MSHASLKVNGHVHVVDVDPKCPLLYVLRDNLALNNPRFGCGLGQCGACTRAGAMRRVHCVARWTARAVVPIARGERDRKRDRYA